MIVRHPLAIRTYVFRNVKRILPAFIIITFVVALVVLIPTILRGLKSSALRYAREYQNYSVVIPSTRSSLTDKERKDIKAHATVERLIDSLNCMIRLKTLVGSFGYPLRGVTQEDMAYLMQRAELRLLDGHLPTPGTNEVALHEWLLRSNGWRIGSKFGIAVDDDDWMPGQFVIVGVLAGDAPMGFASYEYLSNDDLYKFAPKLWERSLVVSKPGSLAAMNVYLRSVEGLKVYDESKAIGDVDAAFDRLVRISDFISFTLVLVVALVVGLLNNLFFSQRVDEFAVLLALGWSRRQLLWKVVGEANVIALGGWLLGVGVGLTVTWVFGSKVLAPRGIDIPLTQFLPLAASVALPLIAMFFSGTTVYRRLGRLDPVGIIERRG